MKDIGYKLNWILLFFKLSLENTFENNDYIYKKSVLDVLCCEYKHF